MFNVVHLKKSLSIKPEQMIFKYLNDTAFSITIAFPRHQSKWQTIKSISITQRAIFPTKNGNTEAGFI